MKLPINKIICDDCKIIVDWPDRCMDLIITSPPYPGNSTMWGDLFKAENFEAAHSFLSKIWKECICLLRPGCKLCINIANTRRRPMLPNVSKLYATIDAEPLGEFIWNKGVGQKGTAWGSYCNAADITLSDQHEYIIIFRKPGKRKKIKGYTIEQRNFLSWRNSIWQIPPAKAIQLNHPAPFPEEIPKRLIILYSYEDEVVFDPFVGIGTTCVAAKRLNRKYVGIDTSEKYCDIARQKLEGIKPNLFQILPKKKKTRESLGLVKKK